jgi:hypothetical protein
MRHTKNLEELGSVPTAKIIQELQPNKTCTCGACEPRKPKRADGKRRLKVSPHLVVHQRAWVKEESVYDYVPQIRLVGQWLRSTGFESGQYVVISAKKGKLLIEIEQD